MKLKLFLVAVFASLFFIPGVSAATINVSNGDDLSAKVASASAGDVLLLEDGTYTGDVTIDKNITLKGASKSGVKIDGSVILNGSAAKVVLDTMTIQDAGTIVDVKLKADLTIKNVKIAYAGFAGTYGVNSSDGIWLEKTANNTILTVENTEIYAKYAIWVNGEGNAVNIDNSTIVGWAALDISNGASSKPTNTQASGNSVYVANSTLKGVAAYAGPTNEYGTIVIGGQKGLELTIDSSTVTNGFVADNVQDLIVYGDAYSTSRDCVIAVINSKLINTASVGNTSAVYNISTEENIEGVNMFALEDTAVTASNNITYPAVAGYVYLTVDVMGSKVVTMIPKGVVLGSMDDPEAVEGYTFKGYFADSEFKTVFNFAKAIDVDTTIYAKYVKNTSSEVVDNGTNINNNVTVNKDDALLDDVPKTGDLYVGVSYQNYLVR